MSALLWALPGLPMLTGAALLVAGRRADRRAGGIGVAVAALLVPISVVAVIARPAVSAPMLTGLPVELAVDGMSSLMVVTVTAVTLAVLIYSAAEFGAEARFVGLMLVFAAAMLVTVTATTLLPLLMAWEVMGAASYALIGYRWRDAWRTRAATTAFLTTRTGDLGLYLAAGAAFAASGSLGLDRLAALPAPWLHVVAAGVLLAAAGKSAQLPFSFWLSGAMAGPSPVSALLHSATMAAAGGYLLLRLSPLLHASGWGADTAVWLGAGTAVALGAVACVQRDLKQLLAASTCAQVGFMVLAAGAGSVTGGTAHLAGHAAVKSLLFLAAGAWLAVLGVQDLNRLRGAGRRHPLVGAAFTVGAVALAGVPPLTLWVTKDLALSGASTAVHLVALAASALSAVYAGRALFTVLAPPVGAERDMGSAGRVAATGAASSTASGTGAGSVDRGESTSDGGSRSKRPVPAAMVAALAGLALPAAGFGAGVLWWPGVTPPLEPAAAASSAAVAAAALAAAAVWVRRGARLPETVTAAGRQWLGLESLAHLVVVRPVVVLARTLARFDDAVLAAGTRGAARLGRGIAVAVDRFPERAIKAIVRAVAAGASRLGTLARRPQTGQLHQYYAQAAVALALLVLVFVLVVS